MQQAQLGMFFAAMLAWVVCGCILTRRQIKKIPTLPATVSGERQPGCCFALEEERGGNWTGSGVPMAKDPKIRRPSLSRESIRESLRRKI
jgi:hypothetical protein